MNKRHHTDEEYRRAWRNLILIIIALVIGMVLSSCKTQERVVVVSEQHTETLYKVREKHDSIYIKDSVFVNQWTKGDTVYREKVLWHTRYRDIFQLDTIYESKVDSVPVPYPVEKEVPAELTWWQQTRLMIANLLLCLCGVAMLWWIAKKYLKKTLP